MVRLSIAWLETLRRIHNTKANSDKKTAKNSRMAIKKYFSFSGRAKRKEFWLSYLFVLLSLVALPALLAIILLLGAIVFGLSILVLKVLGGLSMLDTLSLVLQQAEQLAEFSTISFIWGRWAGSFLAFLLMFILLGGISIFALHIGSCWLLLATCTRRCRDIGDSLSWLLLLAVPFVNIIYLIYLGCVGSEQNQLKSNSNG